jgi:hypothetical protein
MSFQTSGYYAINPRPEFADWLLKRTDADMVELLIEPKLVEHDEVIGKTSWRSRENILRVKILFLAGLRDLTPISDAAGCKSILGSSEISESLFDRWWTIQYLELECNVNEYLGELTRALDSVPPTGNPVVDGWLEDLKNRRPSQ